MGTKDKKPGGPEGKGLKVVPKRDGFRRAGHVFSGEGKVIPYADLDADQVALLKGDPMLVVVEVDLPKAERPRSRPATPPRRNNTSPTALIGGRRGAAGSPGVRHRRGAQGASPPRRPRWLMSNAPTRGIPEQPSTMTYATATDLITRYSANEIAQRADRGDVRLVTAQLMTDAAAGADLSATRRRAGRSSAGPGRRAARAGRCARHDRQPHRRALPAADRAGAGHPAACRVRPGALLPVRRPGHRDDQASAYDDA
jgi:hypothetical protein